MRNFASPGSWKQTLGLAFAAPAWRILAILLLLLWIGAIMRRSRLFRRALISGSLIAAIVVVVRHRPFWQFWPELGQWCGRANDWGLLGAALLASAWGSWRACGENFPHRFAKTAALAVVVLAILLVCSGTYCVLHRLWQSQVSRMLADHAKVPGWDATVLQSQKQLRQERAIPGTQRADPVLRADAERITAETLAWKSVWQPRYLGVIWPALAIAASVLLLRLPTRPLRWAAIVFVLAINLGQASARIFADTEPPRDLIAQDLIDSQARPDGSASRTRAYIGVRYRTGAPGALDLYGPPGAYYIWLTEGRLMAWDDFDADKEALSRRGIQVWDYSQPFRVAADVLANPQLSRIIVWEPLDPHARATDELPKRAQALLNLLGPRWKLVDQREYPIRLHWSWNRLYLCGRLVLAKQP